GGVCVGPGEMAAGPATDLDRGRPLDPAAHLDSWDGYAGPTGARGSGACEPVVATALLGQAGARARRISFRAPPLGPRGASGIGITNVGFRRMRRSPPASRRTSRRCASR